MEEAKQPLQELEPQLVAGSIPVSHWVPLLDTQVFASTTCVLPGSTSRLDLPFELPKREFRCAVLATLCSP